MPQGSNIWSACRSLAVRSRPIQAGARHPRLAALARPPATTATRSFSSDDKTTSSLPRSGREPDPFTSLMRANGASRNASPAPTPAAAEEEAPLSENDEAVRKLQLAAYGLDPFDPNEDGHKFGLPDLPIPRDSQLKDRYAPVVVQLTKLLMRDGKLSKAQRDMAMILNYLRTSPAPKLNPSKPLLPGSPPASHLPLNPVLYLTLAIDSVAPLIRLTYLKGAAGGGSALEVPHPLALRQRRRIAFNWILDAVSKKNSRGSGRTMFPHRVGEEIVAVAEGRSGVWDKRLQWHKLGTSARANINHFAVRGKR